MHPILFQFFSIKLYSYGLFAAFAFLAAFFYISSRAAKTKPILMEQNALQNLFLYCAAIAIFGARLMYVLMNLQTFSQAPLDIFKIWEGGLVYYGGFVCAVLFVILYLKKHKIAVLKFSDIIAPALALGHALGRIGCFFAGCCYGKPCDLPWSVVFSNADSLALKNVHIHPTQLYEFLFNFLIFLILHLYNKKAHKDGKAAAFYLIMYSLMRFIIEFFRGDERGEFFLGLSPAQNISIVLFIFGILLLLFILRQKTSDR
ncbi:MAG: prolipoprotein diacylglyceryl transferase [Endomicrobium sp.]|jgi:phosphatidylglycerol:prolipoprotein diacylglycerol transferase|nr:prolipoprotein diacylglyceryl transferase [Endomicrobium sp.]